MAVIVKHHDLRRRSPRRTHRRTGEGQQTLLPRWPQPRRLGHRPCARTRKQRWPAPQKLATVDYRWHTIYRDEASPLLFSRLGVTGVAAYLIFAYLMLDLVGFLYIVHPAARELAGDSQPGIRHCYHTGWGRLSRCSLLGAAPAATGKVAAVRASRHARLRQALRRVVASSWHRDDEAIRGLRVLSDIRLEPFEKRSRLRF